MAMHNSYSTGSWLRIEMINEVLKMWTKWLIEATSQKNGGELNFKRGHVVGGAHYTSKE